MGYNTDFDGELKFAKELTASQLAAVQQFLGEDCRDHPEWGASSHLYHIDLEFLPDFSGIKWNGAEKTYQMIECINLITERVREVMPDFRMTGTLLARGEQRDGKDVWQIVMQEDGTAVRQELKPPVGLVICPDCGHGFIPQ
jgi:hypothetical protein